MKVAVNHNYKTEGKKDLSFWNREDERIDSMMCGLPDNILMEIKKLLEMDTNPNKMLNEKSWLDSYNLNRNNFMKTGTDELIQVEIVEDRVQNEYADIIDF